jgi:intein/homing endonuclease
MGGDERYSYEPIVGDSFTGDTPLFIKYIDNGEIDIKPVEEIINENEIQIDALGREYDYSQKPFLVLCRSGWCDCKYVYRHKTNKDIYRVTDDNGMIVDVTEDHSLYDNNKVEIKPSSITPDTKLEYYSGNISNPSNLIDDTYITQVTLDIVNGTIDRYPRIFMNLEPTLYKKVIDKFNEHNQGCREFTKTLQAQIMFFKSQLDYVER